MSINRLINILVILSMFSLSAQDQRVITSLKYSKYRVKPTIVNGNPADEGMFPYLVSIKRAVSPIVWSNLCGGSIIKTNKVITAAHCFELNNFFYHRYPEMLRIVAGDVVNTLRHPDNSTENTGKQWRRIQSVHLHKHFYFPMNDLALVSVFPQFIYTAIVSYIAPATKPSDYQGPCYAAGFGQPSGNTAARKLLWAEIDLMSSNLCNKIWEMYMNTFICSQSVLTDVSEGDSGGPLVCAGTPEAVVNKINLVLVGVVSGKNYDKTTLYTRVSAYKDWLGSKSSRIHGFTIILLASLCKYIYLGYMVYCVAMSFSGIKVHRYTLATCTSR